MSAELAQRALNIRRKIIDTPNTKCDGHFGGSLSAAEIFAVLYGSVMNLKPETVADPNRDRFVLSKGHCALGLYAALNEFGFLTDEELASFHNDGSEFQTHPTKNVAKGVELSSGSLGMGFSMSCGIATALKQQNFSARVFILAGNGEANEGLFWEAAMYAGAKSLDNVCLTLDYNRMQNDGDSAAVLNVPNWADRLAAFGWKTVEVDGHDITALLAAYATPHPAQPLAVVATTTKGKGVSFMENVGSWHHGKLTPEQYEQAKAELQGGAQ